MKTISTLGRIAFFLVIPFVLFANLTATLDRTTIYKGDMATLKITASGDDIKFPTINKIAGFDVSSRSSSSQIYIINSKMTKTKSISYNFYPQYSITIPSFEVVIDGVTQYTNPLKLKIIKPTVGKLGDDFIFSLKVSKNKAFTGEAIYATYTFSYKSNLQIVDINLNKLSLKHFWIKELSNPNPIEQNGYITQTINYILFPQLAGKQTIPSQMIKIALRDSRTGLIKWKRVLSNEQDLDIKSLPNNLSVQGNYTIKATVDKTTTKNNEPVNLTLKIEGIGNIDDIEPFKLDLDNQVVYSDKPIIKNKMINNQYGGSFVQKISIISSKDFTIPSIKFQYFNIKQNKIITIKTKPFDIKVKGTTISAPTVQTLQTKSNSVIQPNPKVIIKHENSLLKYIYLLVGIIIGGIVVWLILKTKNTKIVESDIVKRIKKSKNDKTLYEILLPYSHNIALKPYMQSLENNLYNSGKNKIKKDEIIDIFLSNI